jgi:hypothetical protein
MHPWNGFPRGGLPARLVFTSLVDTVHGSLLSLNFSLKIVFLLSAAGVDTPVYRQQQQSIIILNILIRDGSNELSD